MPDASSHYLVIGAVVVALAALAALVNYVMSIVSAFRRSPPIPEELARDYATKRELARAVAELKQELQCERERIDGILKQQFDLLRELTEKTNQWQLGVERMIGRIEGKVNGK